MLNKHILVTGGNSGIGFALCKLLIKDHECFVYLGSRSIKKGQEALEAIKNEIPEKSDKIGVEISWFFYHSDFTWNQFQGF